MLWLHLIRKVDNNGKSMLDVRVPVNKNGEGMIHRWGADLVMAIPFLVFFLFLFLFLLLLHVVSMVMQVGLTFSRKQKSQG